MSLDGIVSDLKYLYNIRVREDYVERLYLKHYEASLAKGYTPRSSEIRSHYLTKQKIVSVWNNKEVRE